MNHIVTLDSSPRPIRAGGKVTRDQCKLHLGDNAPTFAPRPIRSGDKVTNDQGKARLGDLAPIFVR
jgi:hypothetical protein